MKTKISTLFVGFGLTAASLMTTGCIEETFPTSGATEEQLGASAKATEALVWAMPAYLNTPLSHTGSRHYEWGYGAMMHIRDVMTTDYSVPAISYDWFANWATNTYQGESYVYNQYVWNFYWKSVQTTNNLIGAIDENNATNDQLGMLGVGLAFRAMYYLDMAQMFEFLPNDKTSNINAAGNDVLNLTVPIVRDGMTEAQARSNPRATREEMAAFIIGDLDKAEQYIVNTPYAGNKALPDLACVYGLKARYYMWLAGEGKDEQNLNNAKKYARLAINLGGDPMTQEECLSPTNGFNTLSCWMWGSQLVAEDDAVKTGIINWTSWMSNETDFGYASAGAYNMIDAGMYHRMSDTDFRKLMWKAPAGTALDGKSQWLKAAYASSTPEYGSLKFRPANGAYQTSEEGAVSAYPLMRVEEMYFIEAEAEARLTGSSDLLKSFMKTYRDPQYKCLATGNALIEEIIFQKRVELWGEGHVFFDYKRLNMPVLRGYEGTNHKAESSFNTTTRPAWMNFCIVKTEKNNNAALVGYENPDPSEKYTPWTGQ